MRQIVREKLTSDVGLYHRSTRPIEPEAVFGQLKSNNRFNRFLLRGLAKVEIEMGLMTIGHNLRKLVTRILASNPDKPVFYILILGFEPEIEAIKEFIESVENNYGNLRFAA